MLESGPVWHGTAIGWDKSINQFITKLPLVSDRFCGVKYDDKKTQIIAYTAYLPTSGQDHDFLHVLSQLSSDIESYGALSTTLLIGLDSNQSQKSSRPRTEAMNKFINYFSVRSVLENDSPTFHHNNLTSESQIDHILHNMHEKSNVKINLKKHLCKLNNFANISSHDALVAEIALPVVRQINLEEDHTSTYTTFTVPKPKWNASGIANYQKQTFEKLKSLSCQFQEPEFIPVLCELFSKTLVISAEQNFETSNPRPNMKKSSNPNRHKLYISEKQRTAYKEHERICHEWTRQGRPSNTTHPAKIAKINS